MARFLSQLSATWPRYRVRGTGYGYWRRLILCSMRGRGAPPSVVVLHIHDYIGSVASTVFWGPRGNANANEILVRMHVMVVNGVCATLVKNVISILS